MVKGNYEAAVCAVELAEAVPVVRLYEALRQTNLSNASVKSKYASSRWRRRNYYFKQTDASLLTTKVTNQKMLHICSCTSDSGCILPQIDSSILSLTSTPHRVNIERLPALHPKKSKGVSSQHVTRFSGSSTPIFMVQKNLEPELNLKFTQTVQYGNLVWFRLALRWRMPSRKVCSTPRGEVVHNIRMKLTLDTIKRDLPLEFLASMNMFGVARGRAVKIFSRAAYTSILGQLSAALRRWITFRDFSHLAVKHISARKIQCLIRIWLSLQIAGTINIQHVKSDVKKKGRVLESLTTARCKANKIHTFVGRCKIIRRIKAHNALEEAVIIIQKIFRAHIATTYRATDMIIFLAKCQAAVKLQRICRGLISRKRTKQSKYRTYHLAVDARYKTAISSAYYNFEQCGAAHLIQIWLRTCPFCIVSIRQGNRRRAAHKIQCACKRYRLRKRIHTCIRKRRQLQLKVLTKERDAANLITRIGRGRGAYLKVVKMRARAVKPAAQSKQKGDEKKLVHNKLRHIIHHANPKAKIKLTRGIVRMQSIHRGTLTREKIASMRSLHAQYSDKFQNSLYV